MTLMLMVVIQNLLTARDLRSINTQCMQTQSLNLPPVRCLGSGNKQIAIVKDTRGT